MSSRRRSSSGNWNPDWEPFARLDPAWTEKVTAIAMAPAVAGALDARTLALVGIALNATAERFDESTLRRYVRRALDAGAGRDEIVAVLQLASLTGMRALRLSAPVLLQEIEARKPRAAAAAAPKKPRKESR